MSERSEKTPLPSFVVKRRTTRAIIVDLNRPDFELQRPLPVEIIKEGPGEFIVTATDTPRGFELYSHHPRRAEALRGISDLVVGFYTDLVENSSAGIVTRLIETRTYLADLVKPIPPTTP